ncbi:VRR-NUC domain-containing protein [Synechocystis salina]|uniref:VRR-NUC domain-containing protein n=1 Tax=Synechocystis salina LEGE 00031 TaxID=1828736 RepID=A0ABR9VWG5_9SYNC|nr:VRR-NUC domain-containing protein [Synechocystis salina]MBE9242697.1 VRR-NUC domain-containing protein [Synechocystis salina LEGE 00041]MBE9255695.1 VRR-NUC domain-containing protein [Synechocystis salina LEGE 00031]
MRYYRQKTDSNQAEIVQALRQVGCLIFDLSGQGGGVPDLIALTPKGETVLIEVKNPSGRDRLTRAQEKAIAMGWPIAIVRTVEDALALVV